MALTKIKTYPDLTINDLMEFKMELTYDRKAIDKNCIFGTKMSVNDFVLLFGIRPVEFVISVKELIRYWYNSLKLRNVKIQKFDKDYFVVKNGVKILKLDCKLRFLIHPVFVNYFQNLYRVLPVQRIMEVLETYSLNWLINEMDEQSLVMFFDNNFLPLTNEMSLLETVGMNLFINNDILDILYHAERNTPKHLETLFLYSTITNLSPYVEITFQGQVVERMVRDVEESYFVAEGTEVIFEIQDELEPIIQNALPSKAEIEREYRDYIQNQRNNKAGIKMDKKKSKKCKLNRYQISENSKRYGFKFYNPNPQKNINNISEKTLKNLKNISKFVNKPVGFWTSGVQGSFLREDLKISEVLQLFSKFRKEETGTEDETAVGSMTNFSYPYKKVKYYSMVATQVKSMEEAWQFELNSHYALNGHHPEHWKSEEMSVKTTVEMWFDLLASAMRIEMNANDAFYLMQNWVFDFKDNIATPKVKFQSMNPLGTLFFFAVIMNRGLSLHNCRIAHPRMRNAPLTPEEEKIDLLSLYNRNYNLVRTQKETTDFLNLPKVKDYLNETRAHVELVNRELVRYRISPRHDDDKFTFNSVVAYVYKWSWPKVEGTSLQDFLEEEEKQIKPSTSQIVTDDEFKDAVSEPGFIEKVKSGIASTFKRIHGKVMQPITEPLAQATDKALEMLQHMSGMFEDIYNKIKSFFTSLTGLPLPKLDSVTTIISLIMDYLIFVNVDNVLLKAAVVVNALSRIGISKVIEKASTYLKGFINFEEESELPEGTVEGTSEGATGFWTKIIEWITDINPRNAGILAGIMISGLLGYSVFGDSKMITELGDKISKGMRSMSFVGMGFVGAGNVVKYVASIFKEVANWIRKKVGLLTEDEKKDKETQKMIKEVLQWASKLDFYFSGDGLSLIKNDKKEFENAKKVAMAYFFYNSASHDKDVAMPPDLKREITSRQRKAIDLLNFMHRLNASTHFRVTPFHLQFYGEPGVGKSELLKVIIEKFHSRYFSNVEKSKFVYSPNTNKEHWDGYWGQLCIVIDEMWSILDPETLTEWLTIISCMPVLLPMAALEDKTDAYFRGKLILSCTNVAYPRANGVACMDAVWRRRVLVETVIDDRVYDKNTGAFSMALFKKFYTGQNPKDFPHLKFSIMRSIPDNSGSCYYSEGVVLPDGISWPTNDLKFERFMEMAFSSFDALQKKEAKEAKPMDEIYDEWEVMINEIFSANGTTALKKGRDFVTSNRNVVEVEEIPVFDTTVLYETAEEEMVLTIENPPIEEKFDLETEFDNIVVEKCCANKHHLVRYDLGDGQWLFDFKNKTVNKGDGKIEPITNEHRKRIMDIAPYFEAEFKRRFENVEPTSLTKNHVCREETQIPDILTVDECRKLRMSMSQYLNHIKICRAGKYSFESIVDFVNRIRYDETPEIILEKRDILLSEGKRFKAYTISLEIIEAAENRSDDTRVTYHHFLGQAEMFLGKLVPNWSNFKETYVKLNPDFDDVMVDLAVPDKNVKEGAYLGDPNNYGSNWINDWDRIFLSKSEREKIFNNEIGERTEISYCFLEHLDYDAKKDQWYLKWSKKMSYYASIISQKINRDEGEPEYIAPYEVTYLMFFKWFNQSYKRWFLLTSEQRKYLFETRGLRQKVYQYYRRATYYIKTVVKVLYDKTIGSFFGTLKYIWNKYYWFFKTLAMIGSAYSAIYLFRNFGQLFSPKVEGTSKVYFKKASTSIKNVIGTSLNEDNFLQGIKNNILEAAFMGDKANAIGLGEHVIMCNAHFLEKALEKEYFEISLRPTAKSLDWINYIVYSENVYRIPETDLVVVFSQDFPVYRRMVHKFRTEEQLLKHKIKNLNLYYNLAGAIHVSEYPYSEIAPFIGYDAKGVRIVNTKSIHYKGQPPRGSSGGVLYAVDNYCQNYIIGIQCWRDSKMGYGNLLTQEMLLQALEQFAEKMITHEGPFELIEGTSVTEELIKSHIIVEGIVPEEHVVGIVYKSSFELTPIAEYFPSQRIPAILKFNDERVPIGTHPLEHSVNKSGRDIMKPLHPKRLDYATEQISLYYQNKMRKYPLQLLSFEETLVGLPETGNVALNTKTSPGIPWIYKRTAPGKKSFITIDELGEIEYCSEEVREEFYRVEEMLSKGHIPQTSMYEFPKDELRPTAKALGPPIKTRSITVMNFIFNLIWRKYHMSFETYLHQEADGTNPYCIGINPESMSWHRMYDSMKAVGNFGCDLDVGNWDGHYTAQLMRSANKVSNEVYADHGLGNEKIRECLIEHNVFGSFQFLDIVCRKMRGLPSGCAGTPHLNTIGHFVLLFYFFCELFERQYNTLPTIEEFQKLVCVRLYGDDVAMTISPTIIEWWNGTTIAEIYSWYGWPTTSAKKTSNPNQIIPCEELSFLKRAFVKQAKYGIVVGALEKEVIVDLLHWMRRTANNEEQFYLNVKNALEYAWFHGEKYYKQLYAMINAALKKEFLPTVFYTYEYMTSELLERLRDPLLDVSA